MDLTVNYGSLSTASGQLTTGVNGIQTALDTMDGELRQLQTNWEGEAQQAYQHAKAQWTEGMFGMRDVLSQISRLVDAANDSYGQTDRVNASRFQQ
ncbi:WXG100 family type VII secretion target [Actinomyces culturomici]|uniref:WXG100 family type VII secretion target n=1 Tax=Actinomyces culturomici TaxID=1926276 RepID=UPI000E2037C5|nr:WXG100 family type VII secretion target [Actinomyces culturomici]